MPDTLIKTDEYDTVVNHPDTYLGIASRLEDIYESGVVFAWTDNEGTQLDILMVTNPAQVGHLQRGMRSSTDLFVGISGWGMFGFELNGTWKAPGYVGSKLGLGGENATTVALAELINGVCTELEQMR